MLLAPITFLMGGTLTLLIRYVVATRARTTDRHLNTLDRQIAGISYGCDALRHRFHRNGTSGP